MYAVIETGGKQYRVRPGDILDVEIFADPDSPSVAFERVLMVGGESGVQVGSPTVPGAKVTATLLRDVRGPKIKIFKKKRRQGYRRTNGHRQDLQRVRIGEITQ
jgi:large subunit ribosomal protein L21